MSTMGESPIGHDPSQIARSADAEPLRASYAIAIRGDVILQVVLGYLRRLRHKEKRVGQHAICILRIFRFESALSFRIIGANADSRIANLCPKHVNY